MHGVKSSHNPFAFACTIYTHRSSIAHKTIANRMTFGGCWVGQPARTHTQQQMEETKWPKNARLRTQRKTDHRRNKTSAFYKRAIAKYSWKQKPWSSKHNTGKQQQQQQQHHRNKKKSHHRIQIKYIKRSWIVMLRTEMFCCLWQSIQYNIQTNGCERASEEARVALR